MQYSARYWLPQNASGYGDALHTQRTKPTRLGTKEGSITVTLTLVLFLVIALQLVTLEHAYVTAGRTLAFESFDKSLEAAISLFYAPLYTEYGLLAIPVGNGFDYSDIWQVEAKVQQYFNDSYEKGGLWDCSIENTKISKEAYLTAASGEVFLSQVRDDVLYEGALVLAEEVLKLADNDFADLKSLFEDKKGELTEEVTEQDYEEAETGFKSVWNTLKAFLSDGFAGLWFESIEDISTKRLNITELPSRTVFGLDSETAEDELFEVPEATNEKIGDGSYYDELVNSDFFENFSSSLSQVKQSAEDKFALVAYSNLHMDNYLKNENKAGAINYEQEYLIYGTSSDNLNIRKASWSIFGIRMTAAMLHLLSDPTRKAEMEEWLARFNITPKLRAALGLLATIVWASLIAIVETAAILKGKKVDFNVSSGSLSVRLSELLAMTKDNIMSKADKYKGVSKLKLSYSGYLNIFMFMVSSEKLTIRSMDVIEANMRKNYSDSFRLNRALVGFSASAELGFSPRFLSLGIPGVGGGSSYSCQLESAVMIR